MAKNKLTDDSEDKKYFTLTPQVVWALSRDAYDFTLWSVIKMVAGENGECILSTEDLAQLAMMSVGKVSECRKYLLSQKLLKGECRKDPGYPQPVWHLTVPNLWKRNVEWRNSIGDELSARIELKRQQRGKSLHQMKPSPGEEGTPPGEEGTPPGETKKNQEEEPKGKPEGGAAPPAPPPKSKTPPAVKVFREAAHRYPSKAWYDDIDRRVGRDPPDLEFWHKVVKTYVGLGWNPTNVVNMLEFFEKREIPSQGKNGGKPDAAHRAVHGRGDAAETFFDPATERLVRRDPKTGELVPVP